MCFGEKSYIIYDMRILSQDISTMGHFHDPKTNYVTNYVSNYVTKDQNRKFPNRYVVRMKNYKMSKKIIYHGEKLSEKNTQKDKILMNNIIESIKMYRVKYIN